MEALEKIVNFFFEIRTLKNIKRSGWPYGGAEVLDSIAEHAFLAAQIAFVLAKMENANPERAALIALFHDNAEARTGDIHLLGKRYLKVEEGEEKAFKEQIAKLPHENELQEIFNEWKEKKTLESIVAHDADILEQAIQARFYMDGGKDRFDFWLKEWEKSLNTESAKKLFKIIKQTHSDEWWRKFLK